MATVTEMETGKAQPNLTAFKAQYGDAAGLKAYQGALSTWRANTATTRPTDTTPDTQVKLTGSSVSNTPIGEIASPDATAVTDTTANQDLIDSGKAKTVDLATELGIKDWTSLSDDEKADFISAAGYSSEELKAMGLSDEYIQGLGESAMKLENAETGVQQSAVSNTSLQVLQRALQKVSGVGSQEIGTSALFEAAGLSTTMATLSQSLSQRSNEMAAYYDKYNYSIGQIAQSQVDTYNSAKETYDMVRADVDSKISYLQEIDKQARGYELELDYQKKLLDLKNGDSPYTWDSATQTYVDADGNTYIPNYTSTDATGDLMTLPYEGEYADNCVKYVRDTYYELMPYGLNSISERQSWVDNYGYSPDEYIPEVGDVVQTSEGTYGHTAIIRGFTEDGNMILEEANYRAGQVTYGRELALDSSSIIGYWSPQPEGGQMRTTEEVPASLGQPATVATVPLTSPLGTSAEGEGLNPYGVETFNGGLNYPDSYGTTEELNTQFNNVIIGLYKEFTGAETEATTATFNSYLANGDYEKANSYLDTLAIQSLTGTQKTNLSNIETATIQSNDAIALINGLQFSNMSYYKSLLESNKKYADLSKDQEWVEIAQSIESAQAELRRYYYGTAVTDSEMYTAKNLFIDVSNDDFNTVMTKLDGIADLADSTRRRMLDEKRGIFSDVYTTSGSSGVVEVDPAGLNE